MEGEEKKTFSHQLLWSDVQGDECAVLNVEEGLFNQRPALYNGRDTSGPIYL